MLPFISLALLLARSNVASPVIKPEALLPKGVRYRARVPDTLDLAERARLSVHGLTSFLDERANYAPYGHLYFNANPPYMSDLPGGPPNWGKITESLVFARLMCGSRENLDIEAKSFQGMLAAPVLKSDKSYAYSPDYMRINAAAPTPLSRSMLALIALYQIDRDPALRRLIDGMATDHVKTVQRDGDKLYYSDPPPNLGQGMIGVMHWWFQVFVNGCAARALTRWYELDREKRYLYAAAGLAKFATESRFWSGEAEPKEVEGAGLAHFDGHIHSYTQCMMALLLVANETHDRRLLQFVRSGYEYVKSFGLARIGLYGEACATGDMTYLALKLSALGVGDYWDDADQTIRNQLAELQITDAAKLKRATDAMPPGRGQWDWAKGPFDPLAETTDNVVNRNVGVFLSDSTHPTLIPQHSLLATICCTGNCTPALYFAWDSIVREHMGDVQVNLLLNRASPWVDVDSYLPYEGKVVVHIKSARSLSVRMPTWVDLTAVRCIVGGKKVDPVVAGRYLVLTGIRPGEEARFAFPITETTERYTLRWKQSDFWAESTDRGTDWKPDPSPTTYTCRFRGNTLIDISPRDAGVGYPLYQREESKRSHAPMHTVERYLAPLLPAW